MATQEMQALNTPINDTGLPAKLCFELWRLIERRLGKGEVLIANEQFLEAMEHDFKRMIGVYPSPSIRARLKRMIIRVNDEHPETYLSLGIQNALTRFIRETERSQRDAPGSFKDGREVLRQMIQRGRVEFFLESIGVNMENFKLTPRIEAAIKKIVEGGKLQAPEQLRRSSQRLRRGVEMAKVNGSGALDRESKIGDDEDIAAAVAALPDEEEAAAREAEIEAESQDIAAAELKRAPQFLDSYVADGMLDEGDVDFLRNIMGIDQKLAEGEIDDQEAERLRGEMDPEAKKAAEKKLQEAVDFAVRFVHVFESLKRIPPQRDEALKFIIRHKKLVMSTDRAADWSAVLRALEENEELFGEVLNLMERKDKETRMVAAKMPPYRQIAPQGDTAIKNLVIEPDFIDTLRSLNAESFSLRLNGGDKDIRVQAAANLRCLMVLVKQISSECPIHQELRRLKIRQTLIRLYQSGSNRKENRSKVQHFLRRRLRKLYPTLSTTEKTDIENESQTIMDAMDRGEEVGGRQAKSEGRVYRA